MSPTYHISWLLWGGRSVASGLTVELPGCHTEIFDRDTCDSRCQELLASGSFVHAWQRVTQDDWWAMDDWRWNLCTSTWSEAKPPKQLTISELLACVSSFEGWGKRAQDGLHDGLRIKLNTEPSVQPVKKKISCMFPPVDMASRVRYDIMVVVSSGGCSI